MDDLISRQAAIDAILHITNCKSVRELFEYNQLHHLTEMWSGGVNDAIDAVIGVDSAQLGTNLAEVGTDTISRQQAIDAIENAFDRETILNRFVRKIAISAVRLLPSAQPEPFGTIKHAGAENPLSDEEIIPRLREIRDQVGGSYAIDRAIELLTAQHIDADGTLWITVHDIERVKRVIVDENKSKFCRQFYMDAQPGQHHDEWCDSCKEYDKEKHCCPRWNRVIRQTLADAQPQRTGKWIKITKGAMREKYMCSACGRTIEEDGIERLVPIKYPFCHCGAKMEVTGK